jgi:hypothetical protein
MRRWQRIGWVIAALWVLAFPLGVIFYFNEQAEKTFDHCLGDAVSKSDIAVAVANCKLLYDKEPWASLRAEVEDASPALYVGMLFIFFVAVSVTGRFLFAVWRWIQKGF